MVTAQRSSSPGDEAPKNSRKERLAGLRGLLDAFRRIPAALRRPETLMLLMAVFASFGAHMPPYLGLGALADYFEEQEAKRKAEQPVEVSYEWSEPAEPKQPEPEEAEPPEVEPEPQKPRKRPEPEKKKVAEKKQPEPKPEKVAEVEVEPQPPKPPTPPSHERKQSITQKSPEPDEAPDEARFLAEQNRSVEEETVAMVRDDVRDDPEPEAAAPQDRGVDEAGDAAENEEEKESFNESGRDEGKKFVEARTKRPEPPPESGPAESRAPGREARAEKAEVQPSMPAPGTVIQDPLGSFTIATAEDPQERQRAQKERAGGRAGPRGSGEPNLAVNWQTFTDTYDEETLERERTPQRRRNVGSSERKKRWKEFRAAIENYVVGVRSGNTTALNARADPFAAYIADFHRHLHHEFAYRFLGSLPATGELADPSLMTKVEMVINPDGTLHRVGVVTTSGQTMFDFGAFNAVKSGEPYPRPPETIRSADGRVYLRWALHRNHSQCGTWNAEPYIVENPPDVGSDGMGAPPGMQLGPVRRGPG